MIDINQPVEHNHDMVLNFDGAEQELGTPKDYNKAAKAGKLIGLPPNDNPPKD